jgi:hypothetical protein
LISTQLFKLLYLTIVFSFENATEDETNAFEKFYDLCLEVANDYNRNDFTKQKEEF